MAISSLSTASVGLYACAAEARPRRERDDCAHSCDDASRLRPKERGSVLADAMLGAFQSLGWSRRAVDEASAPAAAASDGESNAAGSGKTSVEDAIAEFAHALAGALRDLRRSERGEEQGQAHVHGGGHGRAYRGMAPRLELLVVQVQAGTPSQVPVAPTTAAEPTVAAVQNPEPLSLPTPAPEVDATPPAVLDQATAPAASGEASLNVAPPPAPPEVGGLVDAFSKLLESLRDNGLKAPLEESASESLARFLKALAEGLKPAAPGSRYDTMPIFSGTFIRLTA